MGSKYLAELRRTPRRVNRSWSGILATAKEIVESYNTGVALRQLFYRLVSLSSFQHARLLHSTLSQDSQAAPRRNLPRSDR